MSARRSALGAPPLSSDPPSLATVSIPFAPALLVLLCASPFRPVAASPLVQGARAEEAQRLREAPFQVLDNVEGDDVDLLNYPIKPMVLSPNHATLWAVNTHNSEVVSFTNLSGAPNKVYAVPWNPVALEYWVSSV